MNNAGMYGFRFVRAPNGGDTPNVLRKRIASAYRPNLITAGPVNNYVHLNIGDPVVLAADGCINIAQCALCATPSTSIFGIVMGFEPLYNATKGVMEPASKYPSAGITYSTNYNRASWALVCPVEDGVIFSAACDDASTFTTWATYETAVHENVDFSTDYANANGDCTPKLDISTHATTNTLIWTIVGIDPTMDNRDFSGTGVRLLVRCNLPQPSTTGV